MVSKVVDIPKVFRRKSIVSMAVLVGMVTLSATGTLDIMKAAILSAIVLIATKCVTVVEARRSIELNVLIVIAAALGISRALEKPARQGSLPVTLSRWYKVGALGASCSRLPGDVIAHRTDYQQCRRCADFSHRHGCGRPAGV